MSDDELVFDELETSTTTKSKASEVTKNSYVMLNGRPCMIVEIHGKATNRTSKVKLAGIDIFTGIKYEHILPGSQELEVPAVVKENYKLVTIDGEDVSLTTLDGKSKDNVKMPDGEVGQKLQDYFDAGENIVVTLLKCMGNEEIISCKVLG